MWCTGEEMMGAGNTCEESGRGCCIGSEGGLC